MLLVVCAIIRYQGQILIAQRNRYQSHPLQWEFPGGKIAPEETPEEAIVREIGEELGMVVRPVRRLPASRHDYGDKTVELLPLECDWISGRPHPHEHRQIRWVNPVELLAFDWCEADLPIVAFLSAVQ